MAARLCAECQRPLTPSRASRRYKYCGRCEPRVRKRQAQARRDRVTEKKYGLHPGEYRKMYDAQGGSCAIYRCKAKGLTVALAVDHDHDKGFTREAVRGLVCKRHNRMIGDSHDDPLVFLSLHNYLTDPPARKVLT